MNETAMLDPFHIRHVSFIERDGQPPVQCLKIDCVPTHTERIVPAGNEEWAFDRQHYRRHVEIYVSPKGRSVRVWVDGQEFKPCTG